ncbi:MAG: dTDP-4-dehydrorhamnose reductase [Rhodoglobus sp.]
MCRELLIGDRRFTDLRAALSGREATFLTRADLDVTDAVAVDAAVAGHTAVINAAAYTKVDDAEANEPEAHVINAVGAGLLAEAAARHGARIVQVSTDYVFDGSATTPYAEDAPRHPVSAYGRTKAEGEVLVQVANPDGAYIVRTAWLYGEHGPNFVKTMLALAATKPSVGVVTDQVGQPTWTRDLAAQVVALLDSDAPAGIYHGTNSGTGSWFDFARLVFELGGFDPNNVTPTDRSAFVRPAPRPAYSVLGHDAWTAVGLEPMRDWREALREAFATGALGAA